MPGEYTVEASFWKLCKKKRILPPCGIFHPYFVTYSFIKCYLGSCNRVMRARCYSGTDGHRARSAGPNQISYLMHSELIGPFTSQLVQFFREAAFLTE